MGGFFEWPVGFVFRPARQNQNLGRYIYQAPLFAGSSRFYVVTAAEKAEITALLLPVLKAGAVAAAVVTSLTATFFIFGGTDHSRGPWPAILALVVAWPAALVPVLAAVQFYTAWRLRPVLAGLTPAQEIISCRDRIGILKKSTARPEFLALAVLFLANAGVEIFGAAFYAMTVNTPGNFAVPGGALLLLFSMVLLFFAVLIFKARKR